MNFPDKMASLLLKYLIRTYQQPNSMSQRITNFKLLRIKDSFNRMNLNLTWAHPGKGSLRFKKLRMNYGDSRADYLSEKRKLLSEGLKI